MSQPSIRCLQKYFFTLYALKIKKKGPGVQLPPPPIYVFVNTLFPLDPGLDYFETRDSQVNTQDSSQLVNNLNSDKDSLTGHPVSRFSVLLLSKIFRPKEKFTNFEGIHFMLRNTSVFFNFQRLLVKVRILNRWIFLSNDPSFYAVSLKRDV